MPFAKDYPRYYDLLYAGKDYAAEARYVDDLIEKNARGGQRVLDLGCGTGRHAMELARLGYNVTGVELSEAMLKRATSELAETKEKLPVSFLHGDLRTLRLDMTFDVVVSLFHVMSYQTTNADLRKAFATVRAHLRPGGILVFDCWYGPAVLSDPPQVRVRRLEDERLRLVRIAEPEMHVNENTVDVHYQVIATDKRNGLIEEFCETHRMRYLFLPEIDALAGEQGLTRVHSASWLDQGELGRDSWGGCFVLAADA